MGRGFDLFIDESGDDGTERVRPIDPDGASEYFVLSGVIIRSERREELAASVARIKDAIGHPAERELHFRDLDSRQQADVVALISELEVGLVSIVSNKRNMRGYRNRRVEAKNFEIVRGRIKPQKYNYFYNNLFRYMLERVSEECDRRSRLYYREPRRIRAVFSHREGFRYSQTKAYLWKLKSSSHPRWYFNNRGSIVWSAVDIGGITSNIARREPGLQIADCVASAIAKSLDEDKYGDIKPEFASLLSRKHIRKNGTPFDFGFKLLPDNFNVPLSDKQAMSLAAFGYRART